jgi:2-polyprenyl-3-methyl-5-hydroxy-6-metoxy-1,4-benzoquinol methylase
MPTQEEYIAAMEQWANGERFVPEAYVGGYETLKSHFWHWLMAAERIEEGDRVLDAGCGSGMPARIYSLRSRCPVVAVDQPEAIKWARILYPTPGVTFVDRDFNASTWTLGLGPFDVVVCTDVIEHVQEKDVFLAGLAWVGHEKTRYLLTVPIGPDSNRWHVHSWPSSEDFMDDVCRFLPRDRTIKISGG